MNEYPPKWKTWEFGLYVIFCVLSLLYFAGSAWNDHLKNQPPGRSFLADIFTAVLAAALFGVAQILVKYHEYKRNQEPFAHFWGQPYGSKQRGRIILQSDRIREMTESLTQHLAENLADSIGAGIPPGFLTDMDSILNQQDTTCEGSYINAHRRVFKARTWINRCDAEGARSIREAFTDRGFAAPEFVTAERPVTGKHHEGHAPFEIYMGLGFTADIRDHVNKSCNGFLSISKTGRGDALRVRRSLLGGNVFETLCAQEEVEDGRRFYFLYPRRFKESTEEPWCIEDYIDRTKDTMDYAYILRDVKPETGQIVFHVAGFTEDGTWAAGHYLSCNWKSLYSKYVENSEYGGRFVIVLHGMSPFREDRDASTHWTKLQGATITPEKLIESKIPAELIKRGIPNTWTEKIPRS
jgi:hypothetical protein